MCTINLATSEDKVTISTTSVIVEFLTMQIMASIILDCQIPNLFL